MIFSEIRYPLSRSGLAAERRQLEEAALQVRRGGERHVDFASVHGRGDAVDGEVVARDAVDGDAADPHDGAVLAHAHDRIVTAIGDEEVGVFIQGRVACPGDAVRVSLNRRKIDWQFPLPRTLCRAS